MTQRMRCADCDAELEPWETVYSFENGWYCEDCFESMRSEMPLAEFAELIGSETCKVEDLEYSTKGYDL